MPLVQRTGENSIWNIEVLDEREKLFQRIEKMVNGRPFFEEIEGGHHASFLLHNTNFSLHNTFVSECLNCKDISVWVYDKLIWPQRGEAPPANPDLSDEVRRDYDEASSILDLSPRGAAALIRLAIQKLCKELGKSGKNLNDDIGELVKDGLSIEIKKALDVVRVIGNNAVHPGQINLRDDRAIVEGVLEILCQFFNLQHNVMRRIDYDQQIRF